MTFESKPYTGSRLDASIELGQKIIDQWGTHALMIQMVRDITKNWNTHSRLDEAIAVQTWINRRVKYVPDPHAAEMMADPLTTLKNGGDCDDQAILAASLLQAIGHDARIGAVKWKGKDYASHAVVVDLTARCIVDPISVPPEAWPPTGYEVESIQYKDKTGQMQSMNGLFSKLVKALAKPFQKIFPAKTLLGKIMDPLGITDPKRNLGLTGRVADVVGTAAALVTGAYAVGAIAAGTAAAGTTAAGTTGFWATTGLGASTIGGGLGSAAAWAGKTIAPSLLVSALNGRGTAGQQGAPAGMTAEQAAAWQQYYQQQSDYTNSSTYASGGGGGGGAYTLPDGTIIPANTTPPGTNYTPMLAIGAAAVGLYLLTRPSSRKRPAHV